MIEQREAFRKSIELIQRFLAAEKLLLGKIAIGVFFINLFLVCIPFFVQLLVNHYLNLQLDEPLYLICFLLLVFLSCSYLIGSLNLYFAEVLKRRLFTRVFYDSYRRFCVPEPLEVNHFQASRFLDIASAKENVVQLSFEICKTAIVFFFGSLIVASYHPYFLLYTIVLITLSLGIVLTVFPRLLVLKSIISDLKYRITERLIRAAEHSRAEDFDPHRAEELFSQLSGKYLHTRSKYFRILVFKSVLVGLLIPLAQSLFILMSGKLIFSNSLSLGQFVGAEIVVTYILASVSTLVKNLDKILDVIVSFDKVDSILNPERALPVHQEPAK